MHRSPVLTLALLAALPAGAGSLPAQREAQTLLRLAVRCDAAGLFRVEEPLAGEIPSFRAICLVPVKGLAPAQELRVVSPRCHCCPSHGHAAAAGAQLLLFLALEPESLPRVLPGGLLPGGLAEAARELAAASSAEATARLLALQLGHEEPRVAEDALLSLLALPEPLLASVAPLARPRLLQLLQASCKNPGPFTTWMVRLAERLRMRETVPDLVDLLLREDALPGARGFLLEKVRNLDPASALDRLAKASTQEPRQALAVASLLRDLSLEDALEPLLDLAGHPQPAVRQAALAGLARVAPRRLELHQALLTDAAVTVPLIRALLDSPHPEAGPVLQQAAARDPRLERLARREAARGVTAPAFRALFPKL